MTTSTAAFLSIRDAIAHTGKSASTIRRLIRGITKNNAHADRHFIKPDPGEVEALRAKGDQFVWTLSEELLIKEFMDDRGENLEEGIGSASKKVSLHEILQEELQAKERNLAAIMDQLKVKDTQIERQSNIIEALNERLREGNVLMGSLQRQLQLKEGSSERQEEVIDATPNLRRRTKAKSSPKSQKKTRWWEWKIW